MDFAFIVHPRHLDDIARAYPKLADLPERELMHEVRNRSFHVIGKIGWSWRGESVSGELLAMPFLPAELLAQRDRVVQALHEALDYCEERGARIVGLGRLLPSATRAGHSYTAVAIAQKRKHHINMALFALLDGAPVFD